MNWLPIAFNECILELGLNDEVKILTEDKALEDIDIWRIVATDFMLPRNKCQQLCFCFNSIVSEEVLERTRESIQKYFNEHTIPAIVQKEHSI